MKTVSLEKVTNLIKGDFIQQSDFIINPMQVVFIIKLQGHLYKLHMADGTKIDLNNEQKVKVEEAMRDLFRQT